MSKAKWILLAEDDPHDADLAQRVLADTFSPVEVVVVTDGVEALNCLYRRDAFASRDTKLPSLVLLDLKMPLMDGFDVLRQIKGDVQLRAIPTTVFSSSREPVDVIRAYELGANAYVVKPLDFQEFLDALQEIKRFWIDINEAVPGKTLSRTATATLMTTHR
jgi:CheY-like chemotaxis protein